MDKSTQRKVGVMRPSSSLRPPPLFRSIGLSGLSASLPPHQRLRSIFCRSREVLPANTHTIEALDTHTFTDIQTDNHARKITCSLGCSDVLSESIHSSTVLNAQQPETDSYLHRRAVFKSGVLSEPWSLLSVNREAQDRQLFSHLCPSERATGRNRGRQGRLVTPLQTSEDAVINQRQQQQQKRRKRIYKVDCAGKQKYLVPSLTEKEEDARLCNWLQSLGITDNKEKDSIITNNQRRLFVSRCWGARGHREPDTAASHRRDRRPHFLPPICQSETLLHVPLLLPENSPPPSPCTYPNAPICSLTVPPLQPLISRRK
ncbi:hypothetical protein PAMA_009107 [Pampus argenteus]